MTLLQPDLLRELAGAFDDGVAWRNVAEGTEMTLGEWHRRSNRLARGLLEWGVAKGDRIGLCIGNDEPHEWLVAYMGIHKAGAVAVPLLARLGGTELARVFDHAGVCLALGGGSQFSV